MQICRDLQFFYVYTTHHIYIWNIIIIFVAPVSSDSLTVLYTTNSNAILAKL